MKSHFKAFQICLLFMALTSLSLLGCGDLKKINEVKDATDAVKKSTDSVASKLEKNEGSLNQIASNTDQLAESAKGNLRFQTAAEGTLKGIESGVNGTSQQLGELLDVAQRDAERREKVLNLQTRREFLLAIEKARTLKERFSHAQKYFLAFDFQRFKGKDMEARPNEYNLRLTDAIKEFFVDISRFISSNETLEPMSQPSERGSVEDNHSIFNALVLSMHEKNVDVVSATVENSKDLKKPISLFDVLVRALNQRGDIQRGVIKLEESLEFVREVMANEQLSFQILQARHNGFAVRLMNEFVQYDEMGALRRIYSRFRPSIVVNLDDSIFNLARLKKIENEILLPAIENKRWLLRVERRPEWTSDVRNLLMKIEISTAMKNISDASNPKKRVIDLFKDYISEVDASKN